jgi:hypothetical protein
VLEVCQHSSYSKKKFQESQNLSSHKMDFHQIKCNKKDYYFTCEWQNKPKSLFGNICKVVTFELIAPKMESSSTGVVSVKPLMVGFKKLKKSHQQWQQSLVVIFNHNLFHFCPFNINVNVVTLASIVRRYKC